MNKNIDYVRTRTAYNLNQCQGLLYDAIGTKMFIILVDHIKKTEKQLELYDKEMGYDTTDL